MPRTGSKTYTQHAVQRAMDARAARWGAPPGYYTVVERVSPRGSRPQVWTVKVRLFGGRTRHLEEVLFTQEGDSPYGDIQFGRLNTGPDAYRRRERRVLDGAEIETPKRTRRNSPDPAHKRHLQKDTEADAIAKFTQWTHSEDRTVQMDFANKVTLSETAHKLGRTYYAVSRRRQQLGVGYPRNGKKQS
jgi:hypothetical protein